MTLLEPRPATPSAPDLRRRIRNELPAATFAPRPRRALWFVPLVATVAASMAARDRRAAGVVLVVRSRAA